MLYISQSSCIGYGKYVIHKDTTYYCNGLLLYPTLAFHFSVFFVSFSLNILNFIHNFIHNFSNIFKSIYKRPKNLNFISGEILIGMGFKVDLNGAAISHKITYTNGTCKYAACKIYHINLTCCSQ